MNRLAASHPAPLLPPAAVHYPDSDGQPLAESDFQLKPLVYAYTALAGRYRDRDDVYVSADLFVYYEQGNPHAVVAPDVFVVLGAPGHDRRTYKLWEEPKAPDFVLEITSHTTRAEDEGTKRRVYARLGVREYWRFDPTGDWLDPPLKGERLAAGRRYLALPIGASPDGSLTGRSEVLGLDLAVVDGRLRLHDPATGRDLPASEEIEERALTLAQRNQELEQHNQELEQRNQELEQRTTGLARRTTGLARRTTGLARRTTGLARRTTGLARRIERDTKDRKAAENRIAELEAQLRDLGSPPPEPGSEGRSS